MNTNSMMNNAYFNLSRDESEMAESPIIPKLPAQNYPRPQQPSYSSPGLRNLAIDRLKSRVPDAANPALVPVPLFSSAKCAVEAETIATTGDVASSSTGLATATTSPMTTIIMTTANPTPISPSPSLFPVPPSNEGILASPISIVSLASKQAPTSMLSPSLVYAQNSNGNTEAAIRPPRPASSIYSQNTMSTIGAASTPRTPTLTNWTSVLPGLPSPEPPLSGTQMSEDAYRQSYDALHNGQVIGEQPAPQQIQVEIQVPRLRSPSLPQDRGGRRRTISNTNSTHVNRKETGSISSLPLAVRISEPALVLYPGVDTMAVNYDGGDWPLQKPSVVHNMPQKQYVHRSQGSDVSRHEPFVSHGANKDSISSSFTTTPGRPEPDVVSPRISLADSHTPIYGPNEQRSGWFSDDEDAEQGRDGSSGYAAVGMKEKQEPVQARRQRAKRIKIIASVSILVALIVVGVAVGVVFGARRGG